MAACLALSFSPGASLSRLRPSDRSAPPKNQQRLNEQIRVTPIRVIAADGEQLGVIETEDALTRARAEGMDLVEVAPDVKPPVCKIMDYGKYKYQQAKRQHKGHTHRVQNKEIRLRPKIGEHDFMTKVNRAKKFLEQRDKVVFSVIFRGRENAHVDEGFKLVERMIQELDEIAKVEQAPGMQGRRIIVTLAPK
ncbi:MAG: translation initiation factor IF-3 [Planctomycetota bacterium]